MHSAKNNLKTGEYYKISFEPDLYMGKGKALFQKKDDMTKCKDPSVLLKTNDVVLFLEYVSEGKACTEITYCMIKVLYKNMLGYVKVYNDERLVLVS